jgi:hypothetical protein
MKLFKFSSLVLMSCLTSCGGGDASGDGNIYTPPSYGSIAINQTTKAGGIATNYGSQSDANSHAVTACGSGCNSVLEFGSYMCGALARGSNGSLGWASNSRQSNAEGDALSQCRAYSGLNCVVLLSNCNAS